MQQSVPQVLQRLQETLRTRSFHQKLPGARQQRPMPDRSRD